MCGLTSKKIVKANNTNYEFRTMNEEMKKTTFERNKLNLKHDSIIHQKCTQK